MLIDILECLSGCGRFERLLFVVTRLLLGLAHEVLASRRQWSALLVGRRHFLLDLCLTTLA